MLIYIANWGKKENDPEAIVDCDIYVDGTISSAEQNLILHLTRRRYEGKPKQHMSIQLSSDQVEQLVKIAIRDGILDKKLLTEEIL